MASVPPTPNLLAFETVARRRSFALAAAELHLTASAISHQVARLESHLGVRLFERSARGVRVSPAGQKYLERVSGALAAIGAATDDLRQGVHNSLYVHSAPSIAGLWLMPRLREFAQAHPEISLNLSAAHTHSDFALGQADIDIRYGVPQWHDVVVEPLFEERILPLASPEFIRENRLKRPRAVAYRAADPEHRQRRSVGRLVCRFHRRPGTGPIFSAVRSGAVGHRCGYAGTWRGARECHDRVRSSRRRKT